MTDTTDIEALVAEANDTAKQIYAEYGDIHAANVMEQLVVTLEAQQAVVEAAWKFRVQMELSTREQAEAAIDVLFKALAALDAPPDEKYEDEKAAHLATINEKPDAPLEGEG